MENYPACKELSGDNLYLKKIKLLNHNLIQPIFLSTVSTSNLTFILLNIFIMYYTPPILLTCMFFQSEFENNSDRDQMASSEAS